MDRLEGDEFPGRERIQSEGGRGRVRQSMVGRGLNRRPGTRRLGGDRRHAEPRRRVPPTVADG